MIRLLNQNDADQLACIHRLCFENAWSSECFYDYYTKPEWHGVFGYGFFISSEMGQNDVLTGFILGRTSCDTNDILTFAVQPAWQGKGVGRSLLSFYVDALTTDCLLEVSVANKAAIHLYSSFGFEILTTRKGYYGIDAKDQSDAYLMKRTLGNTL